MQLTGTIGDMTYSLTGSAGSFEGPEFLVNAFEGCEDEAAVLKHARRLFGESLQIDQDDPTMMPEGRAATDAERRAVAQATANQPLPASGAQTQIDAHLKAQEEEAKATEEEPAHRARRSRE